MNKSDLIAKITERLSGDRATAVAAVNGVLEEIEGSVARGERVSFSTATALVRVAAGIG